MTSNLLPLMVVFDLEGILLPFDFTPANIEFPCSLKNGTVIDKYNRKLNCCRGAPEIFEKLQKANISMAIIDTVYDHTRINDVTQIIYLFGWNKYISFIDIYPISSLDLLDRLEKRSNIPLNQTLYFTVIPEFLAKERVEKMGVFTSYDFRYKGMTMERLDNVLKEYQLNRQEKINQNKCANITSSIKPEYVT